VTLLESRLGGVPIPGTAEDTGVFVFGTVDVCGSTPVGSALIIASIDETQAEATALFQITDGFPATHGGTMTAFYFGELRIRD